MSVSEKFDLCRLCVKLDDTEQVLKNVLHEYRAYVNMVTEKLCVASKSQASMARVYNENLDAVREELIAAYAEIDRLKKIASVMTQAPPVTD